MCESSRGLIALDLLLTANLLQIDARYRYMSPRLQHLCL